MTFHPYMAEHLTFERQRRLLDEAADDRLLRRKPSVLRRGFSALRRSLDRRGSTRPAPVGRAQPQPVEDVVPVG